MQNAVLFQPWVMFVFSATLVAENTNTNKLPTLDCGKEGDFRGHWQMTIL